MSLTLYHWLAWLGGLVVALVFTFVVVMFAWEAACIMRNAYRAAIDRRRGRK